MDVRLIDANEILDFINNLNFDDYNLYSEIFDCIDNAPTIDAQPVKRGKWIDTVVRGTPSIYCSMCGSESPVYYPLDFCPNCGAKMCGGDANEN